MRYNRLVMNGDDLSVLGYGCMRFPTKNTGIDEKKAFEQMFYAYENGVNYFDTAYLYHAGKSEIVLGKFVSDNHIRDTVYIADKLPTFLINRKEQIEKIFNTQLKRLETGYIDYYLMHMLDSMKTWEKLKELGVIDFIEEKKKMGKIRYVGFSFHGRPDEFIKIVEDYSWEFCQIQYNYLDEYNQAGIAGLKSAYSKNIGVIVMEPLRGGNLASKAPSRVLDKFSEYHEKRTPSHWALRWLWNQKEVGVVLSGMNVKEHIKENIHVANTTKPSSMTEEEVGIVQEVKEIYKQLMKVPCTGCGYCMPCPFGVDIPGIFSDYNNKSFFGGRTAQFSYVGKLVGMLGGRKSGVNLCTDCGKCEKLCPQYIKIRKELKMAHKVLDNFIIRILLKLASLFLKDKKKRS